MSEEWALMARMDGQTSVMFHARNLPVGEETIDIWQEYGVFNDHNLAERFRILMLFRDAA
jgi:hypothetical protein